MSNKIDTRSLVIGVLIGTVAVLCLGASLKHENVTGRFQLGVGDGTTAYVIDTVSGQVWQKYKLKQKEFLAPKAEEGKF